MDPSTMDPSQIPAAAPPAGVTPNLVDPTTGQPATIAISVILLLFICTLTAGRLYHNVRVSRSIGSDDYFAAIGLVMSIVFSAMILQQSYLFRHQWDVPVSWFDSTKAKWSFALSVMLGPATFFPKVAILLLYLRLFTAARRSFQIIVYVTIGWCFALYWTNVFLEIGMCVPRKGETWSSPASYAQCSKTLPWAIVQGTLNVVTDMWLFAMPLPTIFTLRLSTGKKIWVIGIFATALLGVAASVLGLAYRVKINHTKDTTWTQNIMYLAIVLEIDAAIVCAAMPAFASLMRHYYVKRTAGTQRSSKTYSWRLSQTPEKRQKKSPYPSTGVSDATTEGAYIELTDPQGNTPSHRSMEQENAGWADPAHARSNDGPHPEHGIAKSVAVDVSYGNQGIDGRI